MRMYAPFTPDKPKNSLSGLRYFIAALTTVLLSACSAVDSMKPFDQQQAANLLHENRTAHPTQQMIKLSLPDQSHWKKIDISYGTIGTPVMLVPNHENRDHWTQSFRTKIRAFTDDSDATAIKLAQHEIALSKKQCNSANATILLQTKQSVVYEIKRSHCGNTPDQTLIGKAFNGHDAIYVVYYTQDNTVSANFNAYARVVESAKLVRDPRWGS